MHVILISARATWWGGEVAVLRLARRLRELGVGVEVWCLEDGPLVAQLAVEGIPERVVPTRSKYQIGTLLTLRELLRASRADVVHTHGQRAMLLGNIAARLARVPVVVTSFNALAHIGHTETPRYRLYARVEGLLGRLVTDCCVSYADSARRDTIQKRGVPADKVVRIYNGIPLDEFRPARDAVSRACAKQQIGLEPDAVVIGAVGRFAPAKGHAHLIAALQLIRERCPQAQLVLVGEGRLRSELERMAEALGVRENVLMPGPLRSSSTLYSAFDVFVYPSVEGVFGLVVLEAMACGVPVVTSQLEGTDELIADGENGLLVPPGDAPAIARAVLRVLEDPTFSATLAEKARQRVAEDFSDVETARQYLELYESLLASKR